MVSGRNPLSPLLRGGLQRDDLLMDSTNVYRICRTWQTDPAEAGDPAVSGRREV